MTDAIVPSPGSAEYWDDRYTTIGDTAVSWFQDRPTISLELIEVVADPQAGVVDIGGGASRLAENLLERGYRDITVVDLSRHALHASRERVGDAPIAWVVGDVRDWQPTRTFDVWHDRAAYHFLTDPDDQDAYWQLVRDSVPHGGHAVVATFAEDGPDMCSGLPVARYSSTDLERAMGDGFTVLDARREQHTTPSGAQQSFTWLLARRD